MSATRKIVLSSTSQTGSAVVEGGESGPPSRKGPKSGARPHSGGLDCTARRSGEGDKGCASAQLVGPKGVAALADRARSLLKAEWLNLLCGGRAPSRELGASTFSVTPPL